MAFVVNLVNSNLVYKVKPVPGPSDSLFHSLSSFLLHEPRKIFVTPPEQKKSNKKLHLDKMQIHPRFPPMYFVSFP